MINKIPWLKHSFHNFKLSESVENAYHALAIDDERETFHPKLWDSEVSEGQAVRQVWFCGMHTDVGGGYPQHELSDIPLAWMKDMAVKHGLIIYPKHDVSIAGNVNGHMHDSRGEGLTKFYRPKRRFWDSSRTDKPVVHSSVLQRTKNEKNGDDPVYKPWILSHDYEVEL